MTCALACNAPRPSSLDVTGTGFLAGLAVGFDTAQVQPQKGRATGLSFVGPEVSGRIYPTS
jgi:hypothetical protein